MADSRRFPTPNNELFDQSIPEAPEDTGAEQPSAFVDASGATRSVMGSAHGPYVHGGLPRKSEVRPFEVLPPGESDLVQLVDYVAIGDDLEFTQILDIRDWRTLTLLLDYTQPSSGEGPIDTYGFGLVLEVTADANPANARWYPYPTVWDSDLWQRPAGGYSASFYMRQVLSTLYLTPNVLDTAHRVGSAGTIGLMRAALPFDVEPYRMARVGFRQGIFTAVPDSDPVIYSFETVDEPAAGAVDLRYQLSF